MADLLENVCLKKFNTFKAGGHARYFYEPESLAQLQDFLKTYREKLGDLPLYWLGLGSNTLFADGLLDVIIIRTRKIAELSLDDGVVYAQAGLTCAKLAKKAQAWGFTDAAWFVGIPGTVGGALKMNAGAFGGTTWDCVAAVDYLDVNGQLHHLSPEVFQVAYRSCQAPFPGWFIGVYFRFPEGDRDAEAKNLKALLRKRNTTQPIGTYNCGSVFKNPPGDFAARLIETCGLKEKSVGGARISNVHANFIENYTLECSSKDILNLMQHVQETVQQRHQVILEPEVIIADY